MGRSAIPGGRPGSPRGSGVGPSDSPDQRRFPYQVMNIIRVM